MHVRTIVYAFYTSLIISTGKNREIFKAQRLDQGSGNFVAIKKIRARQNVSGELLPKFLNEASILPQISHPNIIDLIKAIIQKPIIYLVFPYFLMDLHRYMEIFHETELMEAYQVQTLLYQVSLHTKVFHNT